MRTTVTKNGVFSGCDKPTPDPVSILANFSAAVRQFLVVLYYGLIL